MIKLLENFQLENPLNNMNMQNIEIYIKEKKIKLKKRVKMLSNELKLSIYKPSNTDTAYVYSFE